jgi:hypothetical protein
VQSEMRKTKKKGQPKTLFSGFGPRNVQGSWG